MNPFTEIIKSRHIISHLAKSELKLRYRGTVFGFIWSVLEPLAQLGVLYLVFSSIRSTDSSFVIYLFSGLIMIHFFSRCTSQGINCLPKNKAILDSLKIPKIIFPISTVLSNLYMFLIEIGIFFMFIFVLQIEISYTVFILPLIFGLFIILTTGLTLLFSVIRLFFKDIQSIWGIVTVSLIFITPVFWKIEDMPDEIAKLFLLNPLALLMEMTHQVVLFDVIPSTEEFRNSIIATFVIFFLGLGLFKKFEKRMVELL